MVGTNANYTDLTGSKLAGANLQEIRARGSKWGSSDLTNADLSRGNFRGTVLSDCIMNGMTASGSNFRYCKMQSVLISEAKIDSCDMSHSYLFDSVISDSKLTDCYLSDVDLSGAAIKNTHLGSSRFVAVDTNGLSIEGVTLAQTLLIDSDLSPFCFGQVFHASPSHLDFRSIIRTMKVPEKVLKNFLYQSGVPHIFSEYMYSCARSLDPKQLYSLMQSTFISYGGPDEKFAEKLNSALEGHGVQTFFFKSDAVPGVKLHRMMRTGVNSHDRVILVCSRDSLDRGGVTNEIEETLAREARDGGAEYLIPITIDDYVFTDWSPEDSGLVFAVRDRVVADFRDASEFDQSVLRLLKALDKKSPPTV
jgi:hypothetical protein